MAQSSRLGVPCFTDLSLRRGRNKFLLDKLADCSIFSQKLLEA